MRIKTLYTLYVILVLCIFCGVAANSYDFILGIKHAVRENNSNKEQKYISMEFFFPDKAGKMDVMRSSFGTLSDSTAKVDVYPLGLSVNVTNIKAMPKNISIYIGLLFFSSLAFIVIAFCIIIYLYKLFIRLRKAIDIGQIFYMPLIKVIRNLGFLLIIICGIDTLFYYINSMASIEIMGQFGYNLQINFNIDFILGIFGLALLFISQVFRIGHQIEQEQSLTV